MLAGVLGVAALVGCAPTSVHTHAHGGDAVRPSADELAADQRLLDQPSFAVADDAIVRLVGPLMICTGTFISADLVLTAHHCIVERGPRGEFLTKLGSNRRR